MASGLSGVSDRSDVNEFGEPALNGGYRPSPDEEFMNPRQLAYFRAKLLGWKEAILEEATEIRRDLETPLLVDLRRCAAAKHSCDKPLSVDC